MAYIAFVITILVNIYILIRGITRGIEAFAKVALPMLFIIAAFLMYKVLTLDTPEGSAVQGLNFLWTPDLSALWDPKVWISAAGQIFFTLSLGFGAIITYASYVKPDDDIALTGLTSASLNETAEVCTGWFNSDTRGCCVFRYFRSSSGSAVRCFQPGLYKPARDLCKY